MDYRKMAEDALAERARLVGERRSVTDDTTLSDAEKRSRYEALDADIDRLGAEARGYIEDGERESEQRSLMERAGALRAPSGDKRSTDERTLHDDFRDLLSGKRSRLEFEARHAVERPEVRDALTTQASWAGNAGHDTFVAELLKSLEVTSDVVSRVRKVTTASGEPMSWPRRVARVTNAFKPVAEGAPYQKATDGSLDQFTLSANKFGALVQYSDEAATDLLLPIGSIIAEDAGFDMAESLAAEIWAGTDFESALLTMTGVPSVNVTTAGAIAFDDLINVQHSIRAPYRRNAVWYLADGTAASLRKIKDANDNYIWQPAVVAGEPDLLLGKPVNTDENLPAVGLDTNSPVVFGDLRRAYILRMVRGIEAIRSTEYGFDSDMNTLKIRTRVDGGVADVNAYARLANKAA